MSFFNINAPVFVPKCKRSNWLLLSNESKSLFFKFTVLWCVAVTMSPPQPSQPEQQAQQSVNNVTPSATPTATIQPEPVISSQTDTNTQTESKPVELTDNMNIQMENMALDDAASRTEDQRKIMQT
jgi:hypothetical protein